MYSRWIAWVDRKEGYTWQHQRGEEGPDREKGAMNEERNDMVCCR